METCDALKSNSTSRKCAEEKTTTTKECPADCLRRKGDWQRVNGNAIKSNVEEKERERERKVGKGVGGRVRGSE